MTRPTQAKIDLSAYGSNVKVARGLAPQSKIVAIIKANAYGHGLCQVAKALAPQVDAFGVACLEEALALRADGIKNPILLLEGPLEPREIDIAAAQQLTLNINHVEQITWLEKAKISNPVQCWLKIDSGMHRLGVAPDQALNCYRRLINCRQVASVPVICTHFACADDTESSATERQAELYKEAIEGFHGERSLANSAAILKHPQYAEDWIRPGYLLTGNSPIDGIAPPGLRPAMTLESKIIALRDVGAGEAVGYGFTWTAQRPSKIATVAIGYGDGYPRAAGNNTPVLVNNETASLAGRVSMDMITVDVTDLNSVAIGDPVELWGPGLSVDTVARHASTIGYELLTGITQRVPRRYRSAL